MKTYYAKSIALDHQTIFNALSLMYLVLQEKEVLTIIPETYHGYVTALVIVVNVALRIFFTDRPVAFVRPGRTKTVRVHTLPERKGR